MSVEASGAGLRRIIGPRNRERERPRIALARGNAIYDRSVRSRGKITLLSGNSIRLVTLFRGIRYAFHVRF